MWLSDDEEKLSDQYINYFMDFIQGNINKHAKVMWLVYSTKNMAYMNLGPKSKVGHALRMDHCFNVWAKIGYKF
jgi:carboxylesterase type B